MKFFTLGVIASLAVASAATVKNQETNKKCKPKPEHKPQLECKTYTMKFDQKQKHGREERIRGNSIKQWKAKENADIRVHIHSESSQNSIKHPMIFDAVLPVGCVNQKGRTLESLAK
eukprot:Pgem_evm1s13775